MRWIISAGKDVIVNEEQLLARIGYIKAVTGAEVSDWDRLPIRGINAGFLGCVSNEGIDGCFITAHIDDILLLSNRREIAESEFVIANTCIWKNLSDKEVLRSLSRLNPKARLWFAKQELSMANGYQLRQANLLSNIGNFGFQTSVSERILFTNRKKGFRDAICKAFEPVSPILLPKDYGGIEWKRLLKN